MGCRNGIKQVFVPYYKWECYKYGMWFKVDKNKEADMLRQAVEFTGNHMLYGNAMREVVYIWENSMVNFLTNKNINRRAYLGHCAVYHKLKIPEHVVRSAWKLLTNNQRILADKVAEETIKEWEIWYTTKLTNTSRNGKRNATKKAYQMKLL
jgi:NCAIR mutase (PurE)-related protein